ncbi:hypothetical protein GQ53DRAFT_672154 [Thozetella sp. PMI_491]|nr:hypothetical protein GQ53DRAFT_672154 [Thozetella sp. PMI_491]
MVTQASVPSPPNKKRLVVCCDGTWMNSDTGYERPTLFHPVGKVQTPSNVTRIARSLRRQCSDGTVQIIEYQSGVGSGGSLTDVLTGGAFGRGVAENIRVAYSFLCANYVDGDEIVLIGFSRGAFTARSVAGMIGDLGLLTRDGMEFFYPIFKDMENWRTENYKDPFPGVPFDNKPRGENAEATYRQMLVDRGLTRVCQNGGKGPLIKVKAVGVWDTVGSLGIPNVSWLAQLGIHRGTKEFRFYDTNLSDRIEYAFQALALDEHRPPFSPTVWERTDANKNTTELRQVWFPGNHGNIGGGWPDAGIANMSLAWMMDQLASVGVEFDEATIHRIFSRLERYYRDTSINNSALGWFARFRPVSRHWAIEPIYEMNVPVRPWGLGALLKAGGLVNSLSGHNLRSPNMYRRTDPKTGWLTTAFLQDTNERMHSSVRVRFALEGLGLDDKAKWDAPALCGRWRLARSNKDFYDPIPSSITTWEPQTEADLAAQRPLKSLEGKETRWVWEYCGPEHKAPPQRLIVEEPLGPYERQLLRLAGGTPNVYDFAEEKEVVF